jgi:CHRD domain
VGKEAGVKKRIGLGAVLVFGVAALVVGAHGFAGGNKTHLKADTLTGYQEGAGVSTTATGTFEATIDEDGQTIDYTLTYVGLTTPALFAHVHFGNRYTSGGVSFFLCGGGGKPACPAGTATEAVVTGTVTPADVVGPAGQGIAAGEFGEIVAALRAGVAYANVHTPTFPAGEIRGQINNEDQRQP